MINKIYKIINNKYSRFLKFFFFLRYVFAIFLISIFLFFLIPKFFDYETKQEIIKEYLVNHYEGSGFHCGYVGSLEIPWEPNFP